MTAPSLIVAEPRPCRTAANGGTRPHVRSVHSSMYWISARSRKSRNGPLSRLPRMLCRLVRLYGRSFFGEMWFSAKRSTPRSKLMRPSRGDGLSAAADVRPRWVGSSQFRTLLF